jgi:hypothetical protein
MIRADVADPTTGDHAVADVIENLLCEFEETLESDMIFRLVLGCRSELTSCPHAALPERVRRLAYRRLSAAAGGRIALSSRPLTPAPALRRRLPQHVTRR